MPFDIIFHELLLRVWWMIYPSSSLRHWDDLNPLNLIGKLTKINQIGGYISHIYFKSNHLTESSSSKCWNNAHGGHQILYFPPTGRLLFIHYFLLFFQKHRDQVFIFQIFGVQWVFTFVEMKLDLKKIGEVKENVN